MEDATVLPLKSWESFYVIVGSSAAALTGLMFVVITLMSERTRRQRSGSALDAFGTPTIVHFCVALLVSAVVSAPWPSLGDAARAIGLIGLGAAGYVAIVLRRARRQKDYRPVLEDWIWHFILPFVAYLAFIVVATFMTAHPSALFGVGAGSLLLVFIGIHNAWDTVTYIALDMGDQQDPADSRGAAEKRMSGAQAPVAAPRLPTR